ncbi:MAG TPA: hypothetical protein VIJ92_14550 [Ginsengibacter sp.]
MTEQDRIDITFMYLYKNDGVPVHDGDIPELHQVTGLARLRSLQNIYEIGFADRRENRQRSMGSNTTVYSYSINSKGIHFIDTLPNEFEGRPYSYYLKLGEDEKALKKSRDVLDDKLKKITLSNIRFNKYTTLLSLLVAAIALIVPIFITYNSEKDIIKTESTMPQLKQVIDNQQKEQQILQNNLDSLQKLLKNVSK